MFDQQIQFYLMMNKKLWKQIGVERKPPIKFEDLLECSTIKALENVHINNNSVCREQYGIFDNDNSLKNCQISYVRDKPSRIVISENEVSVQIQRSDSSILYQKKKDFAIKNQTHKVLFKLPIITKDLIKNLAVSVAALKQQLQNLKAIVEVRMREMIGSMIESIKKSLEVILNEIGNDRRSQRECAVCEKCNSQGKLINSLTKQYWQLQKQIRQKSNIICDLNQKLFAWINKENNPIKKIERELLQERGKVIQELKSQVDILRVKTINLQTELEDKEKRFAQLEGSYRQNLNALNAQIQEINRVYSAKISKQLQRSGLIQNQLRDLQERHEQCLYELEMSRREKLRFARKSKQQNFERFNAFFQTNNQQDSELNQIEDRQRYEDRRHFQRIKTDMNRFEQSQYSADFFAQAIPDDLSMHNDRSLKYLSHRNTDRESFVNVPAYKESNLVQKQKILVETPILTKKHVNFMNTDNRIHRTKSSIFEKALTNLNEIQRKVKKEIDRSKRVSK